MATLIDQRLYSAGTSLYPSAPLGYQVGDGRWRTQYLTQITKAQRLALAPVRPLQQPNALSTLCSPPCSSQSLIHSSISSQQSSSRSLESPASSSSSLQSLGPMSLCTRASDIQVPSNPTPSMGQPTATYSPPLAKEHASSCPPSITNSMVDIPIVLINGCPEPASPPSQRTPAHQDFVQPRAASISHPCPATSSHSQTLPDASPTTSLEGTL